MKKKTLHFPSLPQICSFSKTVHCGYLVNTANLTLTGKLTEAEIHCGQTEYGARLIETDSRVYSYDSVN